MKKPLPVNSIESVTHEINLLLSSSYNKRKKSITQLVEKVLGTYNDEVLSIIGDPSKLGRIVNKFPKEFIKGYLGYIRKQRGLLYNSALVFKILFDFFSSSYTTTETNSMIREEVVKELRKKYFRGSNCYTYGQQATFVIFYPILSIEDNKFLMV